MSIARYFVGKSFQKFAYNLSGFNRYGLMRDDLLNEMVDEDLAEAIRRLPQDVKDARTFRILRATQCCIMKTVLPKEQWVQFEQDVMYLQPILQQVLKERDEQEEWNKKY